MKLSLLANVLNILQYLYITSRTEGVHNDTQPIKERVFCTT